MKKGILRRGFKPLQSQIENRGKFVADCRSCHYWRLVNDDEGEQCTNGGVTKFDMVVRDNGTEYCTYWRSEGMQRKRGED